MMLPRTRKPPRRNETRDLTHPIRVALNKIPGVRVARNNTGVLEDKRGVKLRYGLGVGSADLVGVVMVPVPQWHGIGLPIAAIGRAIALEVKWPGEKPTSDQSRWLAEVRKLGGFAAVVHSVQEALDCVDRCRSGASQ